MSVKIKRTPIDEKHWGELKWLVAKNITIPVTGEVDGYQRDVIPAHVSQIADNFEPWLFGSISVIERTDLKGVFQAADGGHRLRAALERGVGRVPCYVVKVSDAGQAAHVFASMNMIRRGLAFKILHNAMLMAGDETHHTAKKIDDGLRNAGVYFRGIKALTMICKNTAATAALINIMPVLIELAHQDKEHFLNSDILKGLVRLETDMAPASLTELRWRRKLIKKGLRAISDAFAGISFGRHPNAFASTIARLLQVQPNPYSNRGR